MEAATAGADWVEGAEVPAEGLQVEVVAARAAAATAV